MNEEAGSHREDLEGHGHHEGRRRRRVESLFEAITKALKKGDSITFVGFGSFKTSQRKARTARNPFTGGTVKVPKRRVPRFVAGKGLKTAVNK